MSSTSVYNYEDEDDGKVLTKTQIKKSLCSDQSHANTVNKDLPDDVIRNFVVGILTQRGQMELTAAMKLMDAQGVSLMRRAFTHWTFNSEHNYEVLETLGDTTYNKIVMYYIYRRFPDLANDPDGNYKLTESSKLYKSKLQAPFFSDRLGLPSMARYRMLFYRPQPQTFPDKILQIKMDQKMKTDLFEAFIAALEDIIDCRVFPHAGYIYTYNILSSLLDEIDIKMNLADTKNNKSKLKELTDRLQGTVYYRKINGDASQGVELSVRFNEPVRVINGGTCSSLRFTSNNRVFDAACDDTSFQALEWLQRNCNKRW